MYDQYLNKPTTKSSMQASPSTAMKEKLFPRFQWIKKDVSLAKAGHQAALDFPPKRFEDD